MSYSDAQCHRSVNLAYGEVFVTFPHPTLPMIPIKLLFLAENVTLFKMHASYNEIGFILILNYVLCIICLKTTLFHEQQTRCRSSAIVLSDISLAAHLGVG